MATETPGAAAASSCVGPDGSAIGMPQLCFDWWPNQIFWLILALLAIFFVLSRIALPRIASVLAERQGTITNDIAAAEDLKRKAADAEKAYEKALADARTEAQKIAQQTRDEIKTELDAAMAKADSEIAEKTKGSEQRISEIRASAMENVEIVAKDTAEAIVQALGTTADSSQVNAAVDNQLKG
ncbi:F0F1 ATP synthase subunit B' [Allosediminivita pacifica]|uniref:ATP synthase subunit b n=1 Tax=Allosediminivita pacifica TaxID=1267769 RepID=A0A2T6APJ4_9RHOB|nr:F0F1 ATP synthase subunit B' [Allosediminivita pacifica]PTX45727.1 F-type H+-transporting ATPase subunit b [Allosediminivita pacifica]GGB07442.1 ATP synthase subunit b 2 [Allosediminivita pacifica]